MSQIVLPYNYTPRQYQMPFWKHMEGGGRRYLGVWHRRAGKDHTVFSWTTKAAFQRKGLYWHMLPTYAQGRKVIWNGLTGDGDRFINLFPPGTVKRSRDDTMMLELANGSFYQVVGGDDPDSLRGPNPVGVVFSEFAFFPTDEAWNVVRPILNENGGWAIFISTPMGRNFFYDLYQRAQGMDGWACETWTVDDTRRHDGSPVVTPEMIEEDRMSGMSEAMIQQEYYCSWDSPFEGAIWGEEMRDIRNATRITSVPWDPNLPVETWWDLGINDMGAVWFLQRLGKERRFIGYKQASDWSLQQWMAYVKQQPYAYERNVFPWDLRAREQSTGQTRESFVRALGITPTVAPKFGIADTINEARSFLRKYDVYFDEENCRDGIDALSQYRWKVDKLGNPTDQPVHDQYSHGSDAFRTGCMMERREDLGHVQRQTVADSDYDLLGSTSRHGYYGRQQIAIGE